MSRWALDVLRSALVRREAYVGPWLPEPLVGDPADRVTLDDRVGFALPVVLETLSPAERTAWVLHELFGMPFPNVARVVGRSPAAVRQLAARARPHVAAGAPRLDVDAAEHRRTAEALWARPPAATWPGCSPSSNPDVVLTSDGGRVVSAARKPVIGADKVVRFLPGRRRGQGRPVPAGRRRRADEGFTVRPVMVNGAGRVGVLRPDGRPYLVCGPTVGGGRLVRVDLVLAPGKLPAGL